MGDSGTSCFLTSSQEEAWSRGSRSWAFDWERHQRAPYLQPHEFGHPGSYKVAGLERAKQWRGGRTFLQEKEARDCVIVCVAGMERKVALRESKAEVASHAAEARIFRHGLLAGLAPISTLFSIGCRRCDICEPMATVGQRHAG